MFYCPLTKTLGRNWRGPTKKAAVSHHHRYHPGPSSPARNRTFPVMCATCIELDMAYQSVDCTLPHVINVAVRLGDRWRFTQPCRATTRSSTAKPSVPRKGKQPRTKRELCGHCGGIVFFQASKFPALYVCSKYAAVCNEAGP
ncbi:hypothetical protein IF2G_05712 [Cordyceps javanica]|nr:hypothetical protein IF2G_05712 [Cordyceps javanica]